MPLQLIDARLSRYRPLGSMGLEVRDHKQARQLVEYALMEAQRRAVSPDTRPIRPKQPRRSVINRLIQYIRNL